jgi:lipid II:glycine glycyltransferase (peptidoglycan interpeptide bridge formation enzyme)
MEMDMVEFKMDPKDGGARQMNPKFWGSIDRPIAAEDDNNSIFQSSWWLEAVAPGHWGEAFIEEGGKVVARLPYVKKKKFGFTFLIMPPLTQTLGPWLRPRRGRCASQISEQRKLMVDLLEQLPPHDFFFQNFHYSVTDWLPFYWRGFHETTHYTYVLEDLSDLNQLWQGMRDTDRNKIRKAERRGIKVIESEDIGCFLELVKLTYKKQNLQLPFTQEVVGRIDEACKQRSARKIFLAYDQQGVLHCGIYLVYDGRSAYYLMGGSDPEHCHIGAYRLTLWESIKFAATQSQKYDFEGSMLEPLEFVFRGFGAIQKPYFQIVKINSPFLQLAHDMGNWFGILKKAKRWVER